MTRQNSTMPLIVVTSNGLMKAAVKLSLANVLTQRTNWKDSESPSYLEA